MKQERKKFKTDLSLMLDSIMSGVDMFFDTIESKRSEVSLLSSEIEKLNLIIAQKQSEIKSLELAVSQKEITLNEIKNLNKQITTSNEELTRLEKEKNKIIKESDRIKFVGETTYNEYMESVKAQREYDLNRAKELNKKEVELKKREKDVEIIEARLERIKKSGGINFVRTKL